MMTTEINRLREEVAQAWQRYMLARTRPMNDNEREKLREEWRQKLIAYNQKTR
jgi:hypothetical protein